MLPETHGNVVYDFTRWHNGRQLMEKPIRFESHDEISVRANGCWAAAVSGVFGDLVSYSEVQYLPNFPGSNDRTKFYYHKQFFQLWRIIKAVPQ